MSLFGSLFKPETGTANIKNVLDLVTYMASLVSNPDAIGSSLDTVRDITARLNPGESLPVDDAKQLLGVYLDLEAYLTTKEPLRRFTKDDLRKRIPESLLQQLTNYDTVTQAVAQV